jgi:hypothetical protein
MANSQVPFLFRHGAISDDQYAAYQKACAPGQEKSQPCQDVQSLISRRSQGLNMYDFYRDCHANPTSKNSEHHLFKASVNGFQDLWQAPRPAHPIVSAGMNVPCINSTAGTAWLGRTDVRRALNVDSSPNEWSICTSQINYSRNFEYEAAPIYKQLVSKYRVLVYHGDTDMACDYIQGQAAMAATGLEEDQVWMPWSITDEEGAQTAGWSTTYSVLAPATGALTFITVKGAGHMAPQWKPQESFAFFSRFLAGKPISGPTQRDENNPTDQVVLYA